MKPITLSRMNILCLDLGTQLGWALGMGQSTYSGSVSFSQRKHEGDAQRWLKFRAKLTELASMAPELHAVYFEDVKRHVGTQAAHVYGGFQALLQVWCEVNHVQCVGVGVGTIKKHWCGRGNATKEEMILRAYQNGFKVVDDNQADALAILSLARELEYCTTHKPVTVEEVLSIDADLQRKKATAIETAFDR
jgi:crossover junction endodeoxyribonuclease RuvC